MAQKSFDSADTMSFNTVTVALELNGKRDGELAAAIRVSIEPIVESGFR